MRCELIPYNLEEDIITVQTEEGLAALEIVILDANQLVFQTTYAQEDGALWTEKIITFIFL